MSGSGGLTTIQTLMSSLVRAANGVAAAITSLSPLGNSQAANTFLAAPASGAGLPTFRKITDADLPALIDPPVPVSASGWAGDSASPLVVTTPPITAPWRGVAFIIFNGTSGLNGGGSPTPGWVGLSVALSASSGSPAISGMNGAAPQVSGIGYMTMNAGQTSTFTATVTPAVAADFNLTVSVFMVPSVR